MIGHIRIPNLIVRGGHGALNLAVLCAVMSHGKCWAAVHTLAREVGCCEKSVRKSLKYWKEFSETNSWFVWEQVLGKKRTYVIEVSFDHGYTVSSTGASDAQYRATRYPVPIKNNPEEESIKNGEGSNDHDPVKAKPHINGYPAFQQDGIWWIEIPDGTTRPADGLYEVELLPE